MHVAGQLQRAGIGIVFGVIGAQQLVFIAHLHVAVGDVAAAVLALLVGFELRPMRAHSAQRLAPSRVRRRKPGRHNRSREAAGEPRAARCAAEKCLGSLVGGVKYAVPPSLYLRLARKVSGLRKISRMIRSVRMQPECARFSRGARLPADAADMNTIHAGTSGWAYPAWKPAFYPAKTGRRQISRLLRRPAQFRRGEFYLSPLPDREAASRLDATPRRRAFNSPSRRTRRSRTSCGLRGAAEFTSDFVESLQPLAAAGKLGPVLFQLPPFLKCDAGPAARVSRGLAAATARDVRIPPRVLVLRRGVCRAARSQRGAVPGRKRKAGNARRADRRFPVPAPAQAGIFPDRSCSAACARWPNAASCTST